MKNEGPPIETLIRRLEETPPDFLDKPPPAGGDGISVGALISDLFRKSGTVLSTEKLTEYAVTETPARSNTASLRALACWFLSDESMSGFISDKTLAQTIEKTIPMLACEYSASRYTVDAERREEFVRILLLDCGLRPAGETFPQAEDRLQSLSSVERRRMIAASRESEKRAREIRAALAQKAARDAADKYTRD